MFRRSFDGKSILPMEETLDILLVGPNGTHIQVASEFNARLDILEEMLDNEPNKETIFTQLGIVISERNQIE